MIGAGPASGSGANLLRLPNRKGPCDCLIGKSVTTNLPVQTRLRKEDWGENGTALFSRTDVRTGKPWNSGARRERNARLSRTRSILPGGAGEANFATPPQRPFEVIRYQSRAMPVGSRTDAVSPSHVAIGLADRSSWFCLHIMKQGSGPLLPRNPSIVMPGWLQRIPGLGPLLTNVLCAVLWLPSLRRVSRTSCCGPEQGFRIGSPGIPFKLQRWRRWCDDRPGKRRDDWQGGGMSNQGERGHFDGETSGKAGWILFDGCRVAA